MQWAPLLISTGAVKTGFWIFLLVRGFRLGLIRRYSFVYVFIACKFAAFWVKTSVVLYLGSRHPSYVWIYYGTNIPLDFAALLILFRIYYLPHGPSFKKDWPLLALLPLFAALSFGEPMYLGHRVAYVTFFFQTSVGFLAATRLFFSGHVRVGANLGWLLYGLTVPAALQAFNQTLNYLGRTFWSYGAFSVVNELTTTISWGMIAYGMRCYDPPRIEAGTVATSKDEAVSRLKRYRQALWRRP